MNIPGSLRSASREHDPDEVHQSEGHHSTGAEIGIGFVLKNWKNGEAFLENFICVHSSGIH